MREEALGEVYHAKALWMRRSGIPQLGSWFGNRALSGGGCMLDIGVHVLDLGLFVMDRWDPVSVSAQVYTRFGNRGIGGGGWAKEMPLETKLPFDVDDLATALIRFPDGATLQLDASWAGHFQDANRHNLEVFGTEAGLAVYPERWCWLEEAGEYRVDEELPGELLMDTEDRFQNWVLAVAGKQEPLVLPEESLMVQRLLDGIYESARTNREVRI